MNKTFYFDAYFGKIIVFDIHAGCDGILCSGGDN